MFGHFFKSTYKKNKIRLSSDFDSNVYARKKKGIIYFIIINLNLNLNDRICVSSTSYAAKLIFKYKGHKANDYRCSRIQEYAHENFLRNLLRKEFWQPK